MDENCRLDDLNQQNDRILRAGLKNMKRVRERWIIQATQAMRKRYIKRVRAARVKTVI